MTGKAYLVRSRLRAGARRRSPGRARGCARHVEARCGVAEAESVAAITAHGERASKVARRTIVTESEVNSYLVYDARDQIPVGVVEPSITVVGPRPPVGPRRRRSRRRAQAEEPDQPARSDELPDGTAGR
mgnify:CR=1 FL=1